MSTIESVGNQETLCDPMEWDDQEFLSESYQLKYDKPLTVEQDGKDSVFNFRIGVTPKSQDENSDNKKVRIELTREDDLFFYAYCELDQAAFSNFKKTQRVRCQFDDFPKQLKNVVKNVSTNRIQFSAFFDGEKITFKQKLQFKSVKIFELTFTKYDVDDPYVTIQAQYRFQVSTVRLYHQEKKMKLLREHIQSQNPVLAKQLDATFRKFK